MIKQLITAASVALLITGCPIAETQRVYIGTGKGSSGIYFADLDAQSGKLTVPKRGIEIGRPGFLAISPNKQFIYSIAYGESLGRQGGVAAMKINPDGSLKLINMQASEGQGACHVSLDQTGKVLMVAYYGSGAVGSFPILEDGSLAACESYFPHEGSGTHPKRQKKAFGHSVFPNPGNTHAYVADLGIDKVMIYKIMTETGELCPAGEAVIPGGSMGPRHMKWMPDGKMLYVLNELDLSVTIFQALENGQLKLINTVSTQPDGFDKSEMTAAEIRIHPNGKFLYTSNRDLTEAGRDSITVFKITKSGLEHIANVGSKVWFPRNFNLDSTGTWMIVGGQRSHDIALFSVDPKSGLIKFTGDRIPFEGEPICFEFLN